MHGCIFSDPPEKQTTSDLSLFQWDVSYTLLSFWLLLYMQDNHIIWNYMSLQAVGGHEFSPARIAPHSTAQHRIAPHSCIDCAHHSPDPAQPRIAPHSPAFVDLTRFPRFSNRNDPPVLPIVVGLRGQSLQDSSKYLLSDQCPTILFMCTHTHIYIYIICVCIHYHHIYVYISIHIHIQQNLRQIVLGEDCFLESPPVDGELENVAAC